MPLLETQGLREGEVTHPKSKTVSARCGASMLTSSTDVLKLYHDVCQSVHLEWGGAGFHAYTLEGKAVCVMGRAPGNELLWKSLRHSPDSGVGALTYWIPQQQDSDSPLCGGDDTYPVDLLWEFNEVSFGKCFGSNKILSKRHWLFLLNKPRATWPGLLRCWNSLGLMPFPKLGSNGTNHNLKAFSRMRR